MIEKTRLRGLDIITSVIFFLLAVYIIVGATGMPLKDSYAGVDSVWYVSPALMPFIVGTAMFLLSLAIFLHARKEGGFAALKEILEGRKKAKFLSDANIRYAGVLVPLAAMVYINITRIDFFITVILFLVFTISVFHLDDTIIMRKMVFLYTAEMGFLLFLAVFGLDLQLKKLFAFSMDFLAIAMIISIVIVLVSLVKKSAKQDYQKKLKQALWMSFMTPVFMVPLFRFVLRVPLPSEGLVVNAMSYVYYLFR
jgi:hypothetical protein